MKQNKKNKAPLNRKAILAIVLLAAFAGTYVISFMNSKKILDKSDPIEPLPTTTVTSTNDSLGEPIPAVEPKFVKQGELNFLSGKDRAVIKKIAIEIADTDAKRGQGLMYRKSMSDTCGMLFLFEVPEEQNFWMHNTYIPLDIIYADENRKIVTIGRNCKPLNDSDIPSVKKCQYVIEVNGGWCDKMGVKEGDYVSF